MDSARQPGRGLLLVAGRVAQQAHEDDDDGDEIDDVAQPEHKHAANLLIEALRRHGRSVDTESLIGTLENLRGLDLGIGAPLTFTAERHQGLDSVYFTRVESDRWVPIADWSAAVKA